jgi:hypothetical protein
MFIEQATAITIFSHQFTIVMMFIVPVTGDEEISFIMLTPVCSYEWFPWKGT